jgi:hypothetical protein
MQRQEHVDFYGESSCGRNLFPYFAAVRSLNKREVPDSPNRLFGELRAARAERRRSPLPSLGGGHPSMGVDLSEAVPIEKPIAEIAYAQITLLQRRCEAHRRHRATALTPGPWSDGKGRDVDRPGEPSPPTGESSPARCRRETAFA